MKKLETTDKLFKCRRPQGGSILLETLVACALVLIVATGIMNIMVIALTTSENQGHLMARTAEYSQDKIEQLMALAYCDATTDTTQLPSQPSGGSGLSGCPVPLASPATGTGIGGSTDPSNPVTGYVDYLDSSGQLITGPGGTAPTNWFYIRVWQISAGPGGVSAMKQISVATRVANQVGSGGTKPQTTVVTLKSYPF